MLNEIHTLYRDMVEAGIPAEDARFLLPNAATTKIVMTMNARELRHFFLLRCCRRAQWEIRIMAKEMLRQARLAAPLLFANAGPGCLDGPCPEGRMTCGSMVEVRQEFLEL
jgi:thymidylate synthase (FAD)